MYWNCWNCNWSEHIIQRAESIYLARHLSFGVTVNCLLLAICWCLFVSICRLQHCVSCWEALQEVDCCSCTVACASLPPWSTVCSVAAHRVAALRQRAQNLQSLDFKSTTNRVWILSFWISNQTQNQQLNSQSLDFNSKLAKSGFQIHNTTRKA